MKLLQTIVDLFYPPRCLCCQQQLSEYREVQFRSESDNICYDYRILLCDACQPPRVRAPRGSDRAQQQLQATTPRYLCRTCGEATTSTPSANSQCVACQVWPPPLHEIRSMWRYTKQVEQLIKAYKYGRRQALRRYLSGLLIEYLVEPDASTAFSCSDWDLVLPIPSGTRQLQHRGFAHVGMLANTISRALSIPTRSDALTARHRRASQTQLPRQKRWENMFSAFEADHVLVEDKRILLIDDVMTTGATLWSAAWVLLEAGAARVDALTIARSRQFQSLRLRQTHELEQAVGNA